MYQYKELSAQIELYVTKLYERFQTDEFFYHNLAHTKKVVERTQEIAAHYFMDDVFSFVLYTAAWFHDCGHLFGNDHGHEERSNLIMRGYLEKNKVPENIIQLAEHCILATHFPYTPMSFVEEILCDADSYHFGTEEFLITDALIKKEIFMRTNHIASNWDRQALALLEKHHFYSDYCITLLSEGKQQNIERLRSRLSAEGSE